MTTATTRRAACAALITTILSARAQSVSAQPLRVIVPNVAGSPPDVMIRAVTDKLSTALKRPVVIENKPGAGGIIAVQQMQSIRDGNTLIFMLTGVAAITPLLFRSAKYDVLQDFTSVAGIGETTVMLAAAPNVAAGTVKEVVALANAQPGKIVLGHPGTGTLGHLMAEHFVQLTKAPFNLVGFTPTTGPLALGSGDAHFFLDGTGSLLPFAKGGRARVVTVFAPSVLPGLEGYSLARDTLPGAEAMGRFGLMGPKDMPADSVAVLAEGIRVAVSDPEVAVRLRELATYPVFRPGAAYAETIRQEKALWASVAKAAGLQSQ